MEGEQTYFIRRERVSMAGAEKKSKKVSVWNWLGTLILLSLPGVNVIALILFLIFSEAQAKKSFCIACLILMILSLALVCAVLLAFPQQLTDLAAFLRQQAGAPLTPLP